MATCLLWRPATLTKTEKNRNTELFFYQVFAFINEVFIYLFTVVFFAFQAWARCNIYQDSEWSRGETEAQGVGRSSPVVLWSVGDSTPVGWLDGTHSLDVNYISWRWASRVNLPYFCLPLNCVRGNVSCRSTVPADCIFRYRLCFWSFVDLLFVPWFSKFWNSGTKQHYSDSSTDTKRSPRMDGWLWGSTIIDGTLPAWFPGLPQLAPLEEYMAVPSAIYPSSPVVARAVPIRPLSQRKVPGGIQWSPTLALRPILDAPRKCVLSPQWCLVSRSCAPCFKFQVLCTYVRTCVL
jgi:hypothetical protein